jgi:hypothetical protein
LVSVPQPEGQQDPVTVAVITCCATHEHGQVTVSSSRQSGWTQTGRPEAEQAGPRTVVVIVGQSCAAAALMLLGGDEDH